MLKSGFLFGKLMIRKQLIACLRKLWHWFNPFRKDEMGSNGNNISNGNIGGYKNNIIINQTINSEKKNH